MPPEALARCFVPVFEDLAELHQGLGVAPENIQDVGGVGRSSLVALAARIFLHPVLLNGHSIELRSQAQD